MNKETKTNKRKQKKTKNNSMSQTSTDKHFCFDRV